ncbi:MAG: type II toxin-antitoxin system RelE/ParE family toxin [Pseudomonadota bacterium]|nr:type II toxin-antitoxin system RelE/ParE family toxin [Pseudomonadota bacterium]
MTYRLSARAEADLTDIWVYSAEQWGVVQADGYVDALLSRFVWLSENPSLWKPRPDIAEGLYGYLQQSHVIYFRESDGVPETLEIVRVLHGRMEPAAHL